MARISLLVRSDWFIGGNVTEDPYLAMPDEPLPSGQTVEAAIGKVLAAEREARESVVACRRQAEERLETARREARLISERCDRRIQAMRQAYAQALAQRLAALQDESNQFKQAGVPAAGKSARLRHAVAALARECTGDTT
jgi:vacuolar-type H+-ATPase subunit H